MSTGAWLTCVAALLMSLGSSVFAQADRAADILDVRARIASAAGRKDAAALETLFTDDFTHTHAIGRKDGKAMRVRSLLSGDQTIETAVPSEMAIRFYGEDTAIVNGRSTIGPDTFQWTAVYIRSHGSWLAAASQASRVNQDTPG